jgi:hypothetical protein
MNVGLPGSGVGGIFYLLAALSSPFRLLGRRGDGDGGTLRSALRHAGMALALVLALGVTGWMLGLMIAHTPMAAWAAHGVTDARRIPTVFRAASIAATLGTLALVMITVWIAAYVVHGPAAFRVPTRSPHTSAPLPRASSDR